MSRAGTWLTVLFAGTFALAAGAGPRSVGGVSIEHETIVSVAVRPLPPALPAGQAADDEAGGEVDLRLEPGGTARAELDVVLDGRPLHVSLLATRLSPTPEAPARVALRAESSRPGEAPVAAERTIGIDGRATALFEIRRDGDRPLTLGVTAVADREMVVRTMPRVGRALAFEVELLRLDGDREISLETNVLRTFERQSVSYRFRIGSPPRVESLEVELTPVRLRGEIVEIEVDVAGMLPDGDGGSVAVARRERWVSTRGAGSSVSIVGGDPPRGYRVLVTPRF